MVPNINSTLGQCHAFSEKNVFFGLNPGITKHLLLLFCFYNRSHRRRSAASQELYTERSLKRKLQVNILFTLPSSIQQGSASRGSL